jgi:HEAT repeat protein
MLNFSFLKSFPADSENLKKKGDIPALIRLMGHADSGISRSAAEALSASGQAASAPLILALRSPKARIRLGAAEALGRIGNPAAAGPLTRLLYQEKRTEVRWAAILALGEIGSSDPVKDLVGCLTNQNKFIRYGAARSLEKLGWTPSDEREQIARQIALQDWVAVKSHGPAAIPGLSAVFSDADPATRARVISLMEEIGDGSAGSTCQAGLRDINPGVRWRSVLAAMNCGIRAIHLPPFVAGRKRTGPDPAAAALLNFLFLGIGYNYIGKWWGFPVFMAYMSVLVLAQLSAGPFLPYLIAYPITAVLGVHTYYLAERMSDL